MHPIPKALDILIQLVFHLFSYWRPLLFFTLSELVNIKTHYANDLIPAEVDKTPPLNVNQHACLHMLMWQVIQQTF